MLCNFAVDSTETGQERC